MVIRWIVISVFVVLGLVFLKMEHHTRKVKIAIIALLGMVLYFSLVTMLNSGDVTLDNPRSVVGAIYNYFGWIGDTGAKLFDIGRNTVALVGDTVKLNATG